MDIEVTPTLAEAVKAARDELMLSQADVAAAGGPSAPTLTKIESGEGTISTASAKKLEDAFGWPRGQVRRLSRGEINTAPVVNPAAPSTDGEVLQALRRARGWAEIEVAQLLDVGTGVVRQWEAGEPIPQRHMRIIRDLYAVSVTPPANRGQSTGLAG